MEGLARVLALDAGGMRTVADGLDRAALSAFQAEFHDGVYSGFRTWNGTRFLALDAHLERSERSARALGFELGDEREPLKRGLDEVARQRAPAESRLRYDVLPETLELRGARARVWICSEPFTPVPARFVEEGVGVALAQDLSRELPLVKASEFAVRRGPLPLGLPEEYEHLLTDAAGAVLEGTSSNFFAVEKGMLFTAGTGMLEGITRGLVLRLAGERAIPVELAAPRVVDVPRWDEAFLSSSTRGVVPIVRVAGVDVGSGRPGPLSATLREALSELAEREARPAV